MKIDCTIKQVFEPRSGVNAETGIKWTMQPILIEWIESYRSVEGQAFNVRQSQKIDVTGSAAENFNIPVGQNVTVDLRMSTREYNGQTYNNARTTFVILR